MIHIMQTNICIVNHIISDHILLDVHFAIAIQSQNRWLAEALSMFCNIASSFASVTSVFTCKNAHKDIVIPELGPCRWWARGSTTRKAIDSRDTATSTVDCGHKVLGNLHKHFFEITNSTFNYCLVFEMRVLLLTTKSDFLICISF